ncbi:hypothetical protein VaNZ11_006527, partial [Volvox africanus]
MLCIPVIPCLMPHASSLMLSTTKPRPKAPTPSPSTFSPSLIMIETQIISPPISPLFPRPFPRPRFQSSGTIRADFNLTSTGSGPVTLISKPLTPPHPGPGPGRGVPFLREALVFSSSPAIITLFNLDGKPVHQNLASKEYYGARTSCQAAATAAPGFICRAAETATGRGGGGGGSRCGYVASLVTASSCHHVSSQVSREGAARGAAGAAEDLLSQVFSLEPAKLEALLQELAILAGSDEREGETGEEGGGLAGGAATTAVGRVWKGVVRVPPSLAPERGTQLQWLTDGVVPRGFEPTEGAMAAGCTDSDRGGGRSDGGPPTALVAALAAAGTEERACGVMEFAELAAEDALYGRSATYGTGAETYGSSAAAAAAAVAAIAGTSTVSKLQGYLTSSRFRKERDGGGGGSGGRLGSTSTPDNFQPPTAFNNPTSCRGNISEGQFDSVEALLLIEEQASTIGVQPQRKERRGGGGSDGAAGKRASVSYDSCSGPVTAAAISMLGLRESEEQLPTATLSLGQQQQQQRMPMLMEGAAQMSAPALNCSPQRSLVFVDKDLLSVVRTGSAPMLDATVATAAATAAAPTAAADVQPLGSWPLLASSSRTRNVRNLTSLATDPTAADGSAVNGAAATSPPSAAARMGPSIEFATASGIGGGSRWRGGAATRLSVMTSTRSGIAAISKLYGMRDTARNSVLSSTAIGGAGSGVDGGAIGGMPRASSAVAVLGMHRPWIADADADADSADAASIQQHPSLAIASPSIDSGTGGGLASPLTASTISTGLQPAPAYSQPVPRVPQHGLMPAAPSGRPASDAFVPLDRRHAAAPRNLQGHSPATLGVELGFSSLDTELQSSMEVSGSGGGGGGAGGPGAGGSLRRSRAPPSRSYSTRALQSFAGDASSTSAVLSGLVLGGGGGATATTGRTSSGTGRRSIRRQMSFQVAPLNVRAITYRTSVYDTGSAGLGAGIRAPVIGMGSVQNHRQLRHPHSAWLIPQELSSTSQAPPRRTASGGPLLGSAAAPPPPPPPPRLSPAFIGAAAGAAAPEDKFIAPSPQMRPLTRLHRRMSAPSGLHQLLAMSDVEAVPMHAAGIGRSRDSGRNIDGSCTGAATRAASGTTHFGGTIGTASLCPAPLDARSNQLASGTTSGGRTSAGGMNSVRSVAGLTLSEALLVTPGNFLQSRTEASSRLLLAPASAAAAVPSPTRMSYSGAILEASIGSAVTPLRLMGAAAAAGIAKYSSSRHGVGSSSGSGSGAFSGHISKIQYSGSTAKSNVALTPQSRSLPPSGSIIQGKPPTPPPPPPPPPPSFAAGEMAALLVATRASNRVCGGGVDGHVIKERGGLSITPTPSGSLPRHGRTLGSGSQGRYSRHCHRGISREGLQEVIIVEDRTIREEWGKEAEEEEEEGEEEEEEEEEECWHEMWALRSVDPVTGEPVIVLSQTDVTAKVVAERHVAQVMEAEHRLLEQLFPRHILQYMAEEWTSKQFRRRLQQQRGGSSVATAATTASERPVVRDCNTLATLHPQVTLLFADIKGFTPMCKEVEPRVVMSMLNDLYSRYDKMLDKFGVFKVETIGDCYFVAGGLIAEDEDGMAAVRGEGSREDPLHAYKVFAFAKAMLAAAREVPMPTTGEPVQIRIGIHTGPVVSGIAGTRMPRFCLFGDTVNTASRMESTGVPGAIHASEAAQKLLPDEDWEATDGVEVKGKGLMLTYLWRHPDASELPPLSVTAAAAAGRVGPRVAGNSQESGDVGGSEEGRWGSSITSSGTGGGDVSQCRTSRVPSRSQRRRPHPGIDDKHSISMMLREELLHT